MKPATTRCVIAFLLILLTGSRAAPAPAPAAAASIAASLEANGLTILLEAVKNFPDLVATATNESTSVTLFAPTNDALLGAVKALGVGDLKGLLEKYPVQDILLYHVVPLPVRAGALKHGKALRTALKGKRLIPDLKASKAPIIRGFNSAANVTKADIVGGLSYIHVIDAVLLPVNPVKPSYSNVAEAATAANLTALVAAVTKAGLVDVIADPKLEATIFAPTDKAFQDALDSLKLTLDTIPKEVLTAVLQYHVAPGYGPTVRMVAEGSVKTLLDNQTLSWEYSPGSAVPAIKAALSTAKIVTPDVFAGKSVIHIVDTVLLPKT